MVKQRDNLDFENSTRILNHPPSAAPGDVVIKSDLDAALAALSGVTIKAPTDVDCSTSPDYPVSDPGESYYVTVAGLIGGASGVPVNVGDTIYCKNPAGSTGGDEATVGTDFFIVESNRDQATETQLGVCARATQTEVNTGTNNTKFVTPLTQQVKIDAAFDARKTSTTIGDGTTTTFVVNHGLNDPNVHVVLFEAVAPFEEIKAGVSYVDANNVQISFVNPPATNEITVSIR